MRLLQKYPAKSQNEFLRLGPNGKKTKISVRSGPVLVVSGSDRTGPSLVLFLGPDVPLRRSFFCPFCPFLDFLLNSRRRGPVSTGKDQDRTGPDRT
jgi:hypothetical protein